MSAFFRNTAVALGAITIGLAWIVQPILVPGHQLIYHWSGSTKDLFVPAFLDILIPWLGLALLLLWAQTAGRRRFAVWGAMILFAPSITLKSVALFTNFRPPHWFDIALLGSAAILYLLLLVLWRPAFSNFFERIVTLATTLLVFVAISGVVFLLQLSWLAWQSRSLNRPRTLHRSTQTAQAEASQPRIIWIVLDELSYQQVYDRRYPGLKLPAFDALAQQSTVFTRVVPAGIMTEDVMPSLLTGQRINEVRSSPAGELSVHNLSNNTWHQFDQYDTVFQDALNAGYSPAVVGWWNAYCRSMPAVLDRCYWTSRVPGANNMAPGESIGKNMAAPFVKVVLTGMVQRLLEHVMQLPSASSWPHLTEYEEISAAADKVLEDRTAGFTFLHLPIPHPAGIYDRATGQLTTGPSTYIDNLALADRYLAHIRSILEQTGQWNSCTLIIMGDHGWRTQLFWSHAVSWTREEDRASQGGQFDDRPGYIVKLAGQQTGDRVDLPFHALDTRRLVDALLQQKIGSAEALHSWVQRAVADDSPQTKQ